jgi:hypothetical protein
MAGIGIRNGFCKPYTSIEEKIGPSLYAHGTYQELLEKEPLPAINDVFATDEWKITSVLESRGWNHTMGGNWKIWAST